MGPILHLFSGNSDGERMEGTLVLHPYALKNIHFDYEKRSYVFWEQSAEALRYLKHGNFRHIMTRILKYKIPQESERFDLFVEHLQKVSPEYEHDFDTPEPEPDPDLEPASAEPAPEVIEPSVQVPIPKAKAKAKTKARSQNRR